jgi:class 3 adenylate cyclase
MHCPQCQSENPEGAKFCTECGHRLAEAPQTGTVVPAFEGERKQVTVLFSDLSGYTALTGRLNPEEVKEVMGRIFGEIAQVVTKYEGFIEKFVGDAVLALFGIPKAHEDDPVRAVRAAREIHELIEAMSPNLEEKIGQALTMHTGINTGLVVTGEVDVTKGTHGVSGDTINLASRLSARARPGSILLTKTTYKRVSHSFAFEPLGKMTVKGKERPFEVYELTGTIHTPQLGVGRVIYSELVGRDKELNRLSLQLLKAINGEGSIVTVIGEAGIGKSRLVAELKKNDAMNKVALLEGRALAIGKNLSFHPIIDVFRSWAAIREDDREAASIEKLERTIRSVYPQGVDEVFPFIATLMGMKLTGKHAQRLQGIEGEALEKGILKSIRELIVKAAELRPLVFILENIHWADMTTIEFLESLLRLAAEHRILFITICRPNFKETSDRLLQTIREKYRPIHTEIHLEPLNKHQSETLTNNLMKVKVFPSAIREQIIARTEGNPLFIEEVVLSFIDEGIVELENGDLKLTDRIESAIIPDTIQDVLMARIDMLDEETKEVLKVASVIGRAFFYKTIAEVARPIKGLDNKLEHLKEVQLIRQRESMGEIEYLFKHGLTQEVAYESILLNKRKEIHLKVAGSIESIFQERLHNFYGILAYHYSKGENLEKAEEYLVKAGEEALKSSASSEAINYYQEGLNLYLTKYGDAADPDKLAMFEKNIALSLFNKGQYADALQYFDRVLERLGERRSKNQIIIASKLVFDILSLIKNLYLPSKKPKKAPSIKDNEFFDLHYKRSVLLVYLDNRRCFIEYLRALRRLKKFDIGQIENGAGIWLSTSGLFAWTGISFKLSNKILGYMKDVINTSNIRDVFYCNLFELLYNSFTGNWREINHYDEELVDLNLRSGEAWHALTYIAFHGFIKIEQGAFEEVELLIDKLSEIWKDYENENAKGYQYQAEVKYLMKSRQLSDAKIRVDKALAFNTKAEREMPALYDLGLKAIIQILLKNMSGARESLLRAKELVLKQERVIPDYISSYLMGQFLFDLCLLEEAILAHDKSTISKYRRQASRSGKQALKNAAKYALDRTETLRLLGLYHWLTGRQGKALEWWHTSIEEGQRLGARVELARTYMEVGKRLLEENSRFRELNEVKAEEYLEKARTLFEAMDLQWDLDELDKIEAYSRPSSIAL